MRGLNQLIVTEIEGMLHGTSEVQRQRVAQCGSLTLLTALLALVALGDIGIGARSGLPLWVGKKAYDRIGRRMTQLDAAGDVDELLSAIESSEGMAGVGAVVDAGVERIVSDVLGAPEGEDKGEPVKAPDAPVKAKRETLADIKTRFADLDAGVAVLDWLKAEMSSEGNDERGARKGVLAWIDARILAITKSELRERKVLAAIEASDAKKAGKADERAAKKVEREAAAEIKKAAAKTAREAKKEDRAAATAEKKAQKAAAREASSQFGGLPHVDVDPVEIDLEGERKCPTCGKVKIIGADFGLRRMRRIAYQIAGEGECDEILYRKIVEARTRVQGPCKKCRGSHGKGGQ